MYLDTIAIKSGVQSKAVIKAVEDKLETYARWKNDTGEIVFQAQSGWLKGSYDSALRIGLTQDKRIKARASIPKLLQGHNVTPTLENVKPGIWVLHQEVQKAIGEELTPWAEWELTEVHKAQNYELSTRMQVEQWIEHHKSCLSYVRREVMPYSNGLASAGRRSTIKVYGKGREFTKHQAKNIKDQGDRIELQQMADPILRVEVELRSMQLKELTIGHRLPFELGQDQSLNKVLHQPIKMQTKASEINEMAIERYCIGCIKKLIKETESGDKMDVVRNDYEVRQRLYSSYSRTKASRLYAAWLEFTTIPDAELRRLKSKETYYRHRRELQSSGVAWVGTNIQRLDALPWPSNFSLLDFCTYAQKRDTKYEVLEGEILNRIAM